MLTKKPRLLFSCSGSGGGKTTVTCGVLTALRDRGVRVEAFKAGPDYIDPMFHRKALDTPSTNLDLFLCGEEGVKRIFSENSKSEGISIIEGVMGLYDGRKGSSDEGSSNHLSRVLQAPVILVLDVKGMGLSAAAVAAGFLGFRENRIRGIVLNRCSKGMYPVYREALLELGVPVFGYLPVLPGANFQSRHLGLVTADEVFDIKQKLKILGNAAEETIDLDGLLALAEGESEFESPPAFTVSPTSAHPVIAVAKDEAFCFYYEENLRLLKALGAEIREFSPLLDERFPEADGLLLGGGYPEEYGALLSKNRMMLRSIREAIKGGMPTIAECGGFLYLLEELCDRSGNVYPMVGALPGCAHMTSGLQRFGYAYLEAKSDMLLCKAGERIPVHEFHYSDADHVGADFHAIKGTKKQDCAYGTQTLYAGYPHLHFAGFPKGAERFVIKCGEYQKARLSGS